MSAFSFYSYGSNCAVPSESWWQDYYARIWKWLDDVVEVGYVDTSSQGAYNRELDIS